MTGPCSASPVQISLHRLASNRPDTAAGRVSSSRLSSRHAKCRCKVRPEGAQPAWARRIRVTWAAVRSGVSFFSATPRSSTPAGGGGRPPARGGGHAARPPVPDPRADRLLRHPDLLPGRAVMLAPGQLADQRAALPGRQLRISHVLDQLVTEQRHLPGPPGPAAGLLSVLCHLVPPCRCGWVPASKGGRPAPPVTRGSSC